MRELWISTPPTAHSCTESSDVLGALNDALLANTRLKQSNVELSQRVGELMARDLRLCQAAGLHAAEAHRWKLMAAGLFIAAVGMLCVVMLLAAG